VVPQNFRYYEYEKYCNQRQKNGNHASIVTY
jgi:hypothetical protein